MKYARVLCSTEFALDPTESAVRFKESAVANWMCDMVAADYSADEGEVLVVLVPLQADASFLYPQGNNKLKSRLYQGSLFLANKFYLLAISRLGI